MLATNLSRPHSALNLLHPQITSGVWYKKIQADLRQAVGMNDIQYPTLDPIPPSQYHSIA